MAIRIRTIKGKIIALCAAETKSRKGDLYLNDGIHHALSKKFEMDFIREGLMTEVGARREEKNEKKM